MSFRRVLTAAIALISAEIVIPQLHGQSGGQIPVYMMMNGGGVDSAMQAVDFARLKLEQDNAKAAELEAQRNKLVQSGTVSALDLQAPPKAMAEYNKAMPVMKQSPQEAIAHL